MASNIDILVLTKIAKVRVHDSFLKYVANIAFLPLSVGLTKLLGVWYEVGTLLTQNIKDCNYCNNSPNNV
jgi:hypothetical protein